MLHFLKISLTESLCVSGITLEDNGTLTIERVKKEDEGLYECIASNTEGVVKTSASVSVLGESFSHCGILTVKYKKTFPTIHPAVFTALDSQLKVCMLQIK